MQQIYLKRLTKQDITKSVAICSESVESFWDIDSKATDQYTPISICHIDNSDYFPPEITIHKGYGGEKDWRICGSEWKKLYAHDNPNVGDIMVVRKLNTRCFSVKIVNQGTTSYEVLSMLFDGNDNYVLLSKEAIDKCETTTHPLQQIFYGAPGTGKSHEIKKLTKGESVIRTTFHPDSDYSTFVGCYKPTMDEVDTQVVPVVVKSGISLQDPGTYKEKRITYKFVMQAFLKAYLGAWKKWADAGDDGVAPQFLVIEEINRGNCAQIFGDLFQLLDRSDNNFSEYPIEADTDLQQEIERAFKEHKDYKLTKAIDAEGAVKDYISNYDSTLSEDIQSGRILLLPPNLYIWATMNTSDQSLFPIDSAFKRRWEWRYIPIDTRKENWTIKVDGADYDWSDFLEKINKKIDSTTHSEDKMLGFYFCKAENSTINAERFVNKVAFYLWNDVFKDYGFDDAIFNDENGEKLSFRKFYKNDGTVEEAKVKTFLDKLGVIHQGETSVDIEEELQ